MFSLLRSRFGIPGVISVVALVFAMVGGAYAAKSVIITKLNQISPSVQKQLKGKTGQPGQAGAPGGAGKDGANGANGKDGANGSAGKSVAVAPLAVGECANEQGGAEFSVGSEVAEACNGEPGSPWTAGGTLPVGATETGNYTVTSESGVGAFSALAKGLEFSAIDFTIPLASELDAAHVVFVNETAPSECENAEHPGAASPANPEAESGYLCVFEKAKVNFAREGIVNTDFGSGAGRTGAFLSYKVETEGEPALALGTWAVTG